MLFWLAILTLLLMFGGSCWLLLVAFRVLVLKRPLSPQLYPGADPGDLPRISRAHGVVCIVASLWLLFSLFLIVKVRLMDLKAWAALIMCVQGIFWIGKGRIDRKYGIDRKRA
jgi:hypothetical protein